MNETRDLSRCLRTAWPLESQVSVSGGCTRPLGPLLKTHQAIFSATLSKTSCLTFPNGSYGPIIAISKVNPLYIYKTSLAISIIKDHSGFRDALVDTHQNTPATISPNKTPIDCRPHVRNHRGLTCQDLLRRGTGGRLCQTVLVETSRLRLVPATCPFAALIQNSGFRIDAERGRVYRTRPRKTLLVLWPFWA